MLLRMTTMKTAHGFIAFLTVCIPEPQLKYFTVYELCGRSLTEQPGPTKNHNLGLNVNKSFGKAKLNVRNVALRSSYAIIVYKVI